MNKTLIEWTYWNPVTGCWWPGGTAEQPSREWINHVWETVNRNPRHTFQFLTKNPASYQEFNPWPRNAWLGTTVTNQADADERIPWLLQAEAPVRFVSHEPLLSAINVKPWIKSGLETW